MRTDKYVFALALFGSVRNTPSLFLTRGRRIAFAYAVPLLALLFCPCEDLGESGCGARMSQIAESETLFVLVSPQDFKNNVHLILSTQSASQLHPTFTAHSLPKTTIASTPKLSHPHYNINDHFKKNAGKGHLRYDSHPCPRPIDPPSAILDYQGRSGQGQG